MRRLKRIFRWVQVSQPVRLGLLLFILVGSLLWLVWGTELSHVRAVVVDGNEVLESEDLAAVALEATLTPRLGPLFPGNAVSFPAERVEQAIRGAFPRVASVTATRDLFDLHVLITVEERKTSAIYCVAHDAVATAVGDNGDEQEDENEKQELPLLGEFPELVIDACFLMDAEGVVFAGAPQTEGSLILTLVDANRREVFLGDIAVEPGVMSGIRTVWDAFKHEISVRGKRVLMRPRGIVTIEAFEGWEALFSTEHPLESQMVALRELLVQELDVTARSRIDVIDLRIPGRIYYR